MSSPRRVGPTATEGGRGDAAPAVPGAQGPAALYPTPRLPRIQHFRVVVGDSPSPLVFGSSVFSPSPDEERDNSLSDGTSTVLGFSADDVDASSSSRASRPFRLAARTLAGTSTVVVLGSLSEEGRPTLFAVLRASEG